MHSWRSWQHFRSLRRRVMRLDTDVWVQGGDEHEGLVHESFDLVGVGLDADHAVLGEGHTCVTEESDGVEDVVHHHGLEDVELEVAIQR